MYPMDGVIDMSHRYFLQTEWILASRSRYIDSKINASTLIIITRIDFAHRDREV